MRADQHAVTAGFVGGFDDQLAHVLEDVGQVRRFGADVGGDVREDDFLAQIVFDDARDVGVNDLVVGDAGAGGVGEGDVAGLVGFHQARDAEEGIGPETFGVQEIVVEAAVDDVHALEALVVRMRTTLSLTTRSRPFDEFDPHLLREVGMLEVGRVENAGRQQNDARGGDVVGREVLEHVAQFERVIGDGPDFRGGEDRGEKALMTSRFSRT